MSCKLLMVLRQLYKISENNDKGITDGRTNQSHSRPYSHSLPDLRGCWGAHIMHLDALTLRRVIQVSGRKQRVETELKSGEVWMKTTHKRKEITIVVKTFKGRTSSSAQANLRGGRLSVGVRFK